MNFSLIRMNKCVRPLAWLMAFVILIPASSHIVRGMVLCIGAEHTLIEDAEAVHHDADVSIQSVDNLSPGGLTNVAPDIVRTNPGVVGESIEQNNTRCLDIPLPAIDARDICHQAVNEQVVDTGFLSPIRAVATSAVSLPTSDKAQIQPRSANLIDTSLSLSHSTVVLLI